MEYNNYYATPSSIQNPQQVQMMPAGVNNMMHAPSPIPQPHTPQNIRQVVTPGAPQGQPMTQSMQHQQHLGLMHHQMPPSGPQQQASHNYHQQLPLQHQANTGPLPPAPHSASPASHIHSPHQHNLQPSPRPPTGPSPHSHIHQHSPHLHGGPPPPHMHMQSQQLNQITGNGGQPTMMLQSGVNGQPQPPHQQTNMHPQSFIPGSNIHYSQPPSAGPPHQHPPSLVGPPHPHNQAHSPHHINPIHHHHNLQQQHMPPASSYIQHPNNQQNHPERGTPFFQNIPQTEFRIIELNKRLQNKPNFRYSTNPMPLTECSEEYYWWERFASDFFDDDSTLTFRLQDRNVRVELSPDDKIVEYRIGRTLIPRFFRSYFDGGVTDLSIKLRNTREITHNPSLLTLECDQADITTKNIFQHPAANMQLCVIVHTEGRLSLDFVNNSFDTLLIKSWRFYTSQCREYIDRSMTAAGLSNAFLVEPVTRYGLTKQTLSFLKMCMIMEPMQELMFQHRQTKIDPRTCLKRLLVDKYKHKSFEDTRAQPNKRRKRRTPAATGVNKKGKANNVNNSNANTMNNNSNNIGYNNNISNSLMSPSTGVGIPNLSLAPQDVMVVSEQSISPIDDALPNISVADTDLIEEQKEQEHQIFEEVEQQKQSNVPAEVIDEKPPEAPVTDEKPPELEPVQEKTPDLPETVEEAPERTVVEEEPTIHNTEEVVEKENRIKFALSPPSSNNKISLASNGSSIKQNRRRSSERKETLREGLMRTQDFVVAMKDLKKDHPALWRITTGNNLLQQYEPKTQNGGVLYENTNQYAGWNPEIKRDYVGVDVKLTQHTRNNITVERLLLNFHKIEDEEAFYDKHFAIYLQIVISITLDPEFWEGIANEAEHHDYFLTSHRIIEDVLKRFKIKLSNKLKLSETTIKNIEKYPNLIIKPNGKDEKEQICRACNTNTSTQILSFGNRSYDLHSFKPVKVTSELTKVDDKDLYNNLCDECLEIVKLYSEIHHTGWRLYNLAREKVESQRAKGKPMDDILDECLKDQDWLGKIYAERDSLWSKV